MRVTAILSCMVSAPILSAGILHDLGLKNSGAAMIVISTLAVILLPWIKETLEQPKWQSRNK